MIKNDKQQGTPFVDYTATKAEIESLPNMRFGAHAVATNHPTAPFGVYTGAGWHWYSTGGVGDIWVEKAGDTMTGRLAINLSNNPIAQLVTHSITDGTVNNFTYNVATTLTPSVAVTAVSRLLNFIGTLAGSGGDTGGAGFEGAIYDVRNNQTSGTLSSLYGNRVILRSLNAGITTNAVGYSADLRYTGAGNIGSFLGYDVFLQSMSGGGIVSNTYGYRAQNLGNAKVTNSYAFYANSQSGSTNNYAIFTNAGLNELNDQLFVDGSADRIQLILQNHSTQTTNPFELQNSSGVAQLYFEPDGEIVIPQDSKAIKFGAGVDASIYYDGTNLIVNPKVVGTGFLSLLGDLSIVDEDIILGTTTGSKIGTVTTQKLAFWNATPIVQPTTAVTASTFAANTSGIVDDSATFDGYTIGQIVKALRNVGLLA